MVQQIDEKPWEISSNFKAWVQNPTNPYLILFFSTTRPPKVPRGATESELRQQIL